MRFPFLFAALLLAENAAAETVRIETKGRRRPLIEIAHEGFAAPLAHCVGTCTFELPRGKYRVAFGATPNTYTYDDTIRVKGPTNVAIEPGDKESRRVLIVLGSAFLAGSLVSLAWGMMTEWSDNPETGREAYFGAASIVGCVLGAASIASFIGASTLKPSVTYSAATRTTALGAAWTF